MHNRLMKPDADESKTKDFYFRLHNVVRHYSWGQKDSRVIIIGYLIYLNLLILSFLTEKDIIDVWAHNVPWVQKLGNGLQYVNLLRVLSLLSVKAFLAIYYSIVPIVITLNAFLPLGLIFRTVYWIETVNNRIIGRAYLWTSILLFYHCSDILLLPYSPRLDNLCDGESIDSCLGSAHLLTMKILGTLLTIIWLSFITAILSLISNSRISRGRYFIRYTYSAEIIILWIIVLNRLATHLSYNKLNELKMMANFLLFLFLLFDIKWGRGIVHPLARKYYILFCITPVWFLMGQIIVFLGGNILKEGFIVFSLAYVLFIPVYLFKTPVFDLSSITKEGSGGIDSAEGLLTKLDTLLVLLKEEQIQPMYSILFEGVISGLQEYPPGEETELLNNFERKDLKDKDFFFKKRRAAILRLISLYYMRGISTYTDFIELRFSFVYFMFDYLGLKNQSIQFLMEMQGHDMKSADFFKWIMVKTDIETEMVESDEESRREKSQLNRNNQKLKYDHLVTELEKNIVKIIELWKLVLEENTKVSSIKDLLDIVTSNISELEEYWDREKKYFDNIPKCQIIYGLFLRECINQVDRGDALIKAAFEELEKQKMVSLNFQDIDSTVGLGDMDRAIAFIRVNKKFSTAYIDNCSLVFARYLNTERKVIVGTLLKEYMPGELLDHFIESALNNAYQTTTVVGVNSKNKDEQSIADRNSITGASNTGAKRLNGELQVKFPFVTSNGRLIKEMYVEKKVFEDPNGETILAVSLRLDNDFNSAKFIYRGESLIIKYMNPIFLANYISMPDADFTIPEAIHLKEVLPLDIIAKITSCVTSSTKAEFGLAPGGEGPADIFQIITSQAATNKLKAEWNGSIYEIKVILLPEDLVLVRLSRDTSGEKGTDDNPTITNTTRYMSKAIKDVKFCFYVDPSTLKVIGEYASLGEVDRLGTSALYCPSLYHERQYTQSLGRVIADKSLREGEGLTNYADGVITMKLNDEGRVQEVFLHDDSAEEEEKEQIQTGRKSNHNNIAKKDRIETENEINGYSRFAELRDPIAMKRVIHKLGRSKFFTIKILAIAIKLMINVSAGIIFYMLNIDLFNTLNKKMWLYNNISIVSMNLMQISYLNMEKILWQEGRFDINLNRIGSIDDIFALNDNISKSLLENIENKLGDVATLLKDIDLTVPTDMWYKDKYFRVFKNDYLPAETTTGKEGMSIIISSAFAHLKQPKDYYSRDNRELKAFFENCRDGLIDAVNKFLQHLHYAHTEFSTTRRLLLLLLLLGKIGLGIIFVTSAMTLYFKENAKKQEVISLFYGFSQNDLKQLLINNEKVMNVIVTKDYHDSDTGIDQDKLIEDDKRDGVREEEPEDEQSMHIMMAKRSKNRGSMEKTFDFNKFFIIFFAAINTAYFIFLYFWNTSNYMEYWSLARLSRDNNDLALDINNSYNKLITTVYNPLTQYSANIENLEDNFARYRQYRKQSLLELLGNKYSKQNTFNELFNLFFQDNCPMISKDTRYADICPTVMHGSIKRGYLMVVTHFISEIEIYNGYIRYLKAFSSGGNPSWPFQKSVACRDAMVQQGSWTKEDIWSCFTKALEFEETRISYKCFLSQLLTSIINKIGYQVESGISVTNRFNLQFLVIVLLLITLFLGISWIFILVKDNADFTRMKMFFTNIPFEYIDRNIKMKQTIVREIYSK